MVTCKESVLTTYVKYIVDESEKDNSPENKTKHKQLIKFLNLLVTLGHMKLSPTFSNFFFFKLFFGHLQLH